MTNFLQNLIACEKKEYVRNYNDALDKNVTRIKNGQEQKLPFFRTNLVFGGVVKPDDFSKVPLHIYILFLYLSGSEEAGRVTISVGQDNR